MSPEEQQHLTRIPTRSVYAKNRVERSQNINKMEKELCESCTTHQHYNIIK